MRAFRTGTAAALIVWKFAALALLPVAFCCQAAMAVGGSAGLACCEGDEHGALCPLQRDEDGAGAAHDELRKAACDSFDDALIGLLSLSDFTPDHFDLSADPAAVGRVRGVLQAADSFDGLLVSPPPRA